MCQACGHSSPRWLGRCPGCQGWNTLVEERVSAKPAAAGRQAVAEAPEVNWLDSVAEKDGVRVSTGIKEFDRVLGGGLVPGSFVLLGGDPGAGKSTLLLQAASRLATVSPPVLYVSAEESPVQVRLRASRLGIGGEGLAVLAATQVEAIEEAVVKLKPAAVIVDSIQTIWSEALATAPGSVAQVRECAGQLLRLAKTGGTAVFVVCHVTKDGTLAGPKTLEHLADAVLEFDGDRHHVYRILRSAKNRFGSTNEIGVFEMTGSGMREVEDLGSLFLPPASDSLTGRAVAACMEGSRPLLVEIQALTGQANFGMPQRRAAGIESNRLAILLAVLEKQLGLRLSGADVFLNVAGGLLIEEPAADLASAMAVVSSFRDRPLARAVLMGEVGLAGEVRPVVNVERRLEEAARLGFSRCILPEGNRKTLSSAPAGVKTEGVSDLSQALEAVLC